VTTAGQDRQDPFALVDAVERVAWTTAGEPDQRLAREPDLQVPLRATAFFAGRDPCLPAARELAGHS
jgi:hypothetical protein